MCSGFSWLQPPRYLGHLAVLSGATGREQHRKQGRQNTPASTRHACGAGHGSSPPSPVLVVAPAEETARAAKLGGPQWGAVRASVLEVWSPGLGGKGAGRA